MSSDPAILFYTSDWLSGTLLFTWEQKGQYIELLCIQHQIFPNHIPKDRMMSVCSSYDNPVFKKFVYDAWGDYYNERMEIEIKKRVSYCESRRLASHSRKILKDHTAHHTIDHTIEHTMHRMGNRNETRIKYNNIKSLEGGMGGTKPEEVGDSPTWRTSFEEYEKQVSAAYDRLITDPEWLRERKKYHPSLDIRLSMEKAFNDFWGQEAGWKHKKKSKTKEIDWDSTFKNALTLRSNQVYEKRV